MRATCYAFATALLLAAAACSPCGEPHQGRSLTIEIRAPNGNYIGGDYRLIFGAEVGPQHECTAVRAAGRWQFEDPACDGPILLGGTGDNPLIAIMLEGPDEVDLRVEINGSTFGQAVLAPEYEPTLQTTACPDETESAREVMALNG